MNKVTLELFMEGWTQAEWWKDSLPEADNSILANSPKRNEHHKTRE